METNAETKVIERLNLSYVVGVIAKNRGHDFGHGKGLIFAGFSWRSHIDQFSINGMVWLLGRAARWPSRAALERRRAISQHRVPNKFDRYSALLYKPIMKLVERKVRAHLLPVIVA